MSRQTPLPVSVPSDWIKRIDEIVKNKYPTFRDRTHFIHYYIYLAIEENEKTENNNT